MKALRAAAGPPYTSLPAPWRPEPFWKERSLDADVLARVAFDAMGDKQVEDLVILDMRPVSMLCDYFVIGTAQSERQLRAVVDGVADAVRRKADTKPMSTEGEPESGWMLLDFGDVIVHVFDPEKRRYYALDSVWGGAPLVVRMP